MIKTSPSSHSRPDAVLQALEEIPKLRADLDRLSVAVDEIIAKRKLTADERRDKMREYMRKRRAEDKAKVDALKPDTGEA